MSWEIFLGIAALIGFIASITGPMIKLNTSITKLNLSIETLQKAIDVLDDTNEKSHKKIWLHNDEQDEIIEKHEERLDKVERKMDIALALHPELTRANPIASGNFDNG